jgi:class 3 adenylate cyclase/tetratricopeptide (TPR) repeat protein
VATDSTRAVRATATVLFTDLVGSTELRTRLGERAAEELRRKHDRLLTEAVEGHGGRVVKGLGDGIMATFTGASDAAAGAVAIQKAISRLSRSGQAAEPLSLRIGLSAGDVTFEDEDVHGTPVIEASRLCAAAAGGEILAADVVRVLAGLDDYDLAERGSLELKGLQKPVSAWQIHWEPAAASTIPIPTLVTDVGRIFVGRDAELERLVQLWKEVAAGERRVALLAGEPGVGKTRLAAELAARVHDEGGAVLAGRCDDDLGVPYQPFVEALRHFIDHTALRPAGLGRYGGELARLVPELTERIPDLSAPLQSDPETERYRLFDAVSSWLTVASVEEPLLLVLDDLHWATKPTLMLLRHVVRVGGGRVLVLGIYRDTELTHDHPLVDVLVDLRRLGGLERLSLSGLDDLGVRRLVEQAAGRTLDEDGLALSQAVYQETEGNPFFVREVLRHLAETGAVEPGEGGWTTRLPVDQLGIPEGVREVVGHRLSRLSGDTNHALRIAAVVGPEFELGVVQAAGNLSEEALLGAVEEAAGARLVTEVSGTRFRFAHALVRATLYESLTAARKIALHRRVAEAIETSHKGALDDYLPALAHHWARFAVPGADTTRAIEYATRAGDRALAQLAHDEAAAYYRQALDLLAVAEGPAQESQRLELLISLGQAERRAGQPGYRGTLLAAAKLAQAAGDSQRLSRAALAISGGSFSTVGGFDPELLAVLEAALEAVGKENSGVRAQLLANLAVELTWDPDRDRRLALNDEALAMAERLGDEAILGSVLAARCISMWDPMSVPERLTNTARLLTVSERLTDPVVHFWALWRRTIVLNDVGAEEADRTLEACERQASELRQPSLCWYATYYRGTQLLMHGKTQDGERFANDALELARDIDERRASLFFAIQQFYIRFEQGRLAESEDSIREAAARAPTVPLYQALPALLYCEVGRDDDARRLLAKLDEIGFESFPLNNTWMVSVAASSLVAAHLRDVKSAATLYDVLAPFADYMACHTLIWLGCVAYHLGILATTLGRWNQAETHFTAAARSHSRIGAPTWLARTRLEWGRMLLGRQEREDIERARAFFQDALKSARDLGLGNVERRAAKLLQDLI